MSSSGVPIFDGTKGDRRYKRDTRRPKHVPEKNSEEDEPSEKQEFGRILQEVQKLGASQFSWKERKEYESKKLSALGAKPTKSFKMPIAMGMSIKRKREKLEADQLEQDILAGFLPGNSRKRTSYRDRSVADKGLRLSEGKFKGGVLYVQKPVAKRAGDEKAGRNLSLDRVFNEGGRKEAGKSRKGSGKKGGGKKKGGKRKH